MNLPPECRQGYLGDIGLKTLPELKELLERQEKILSRKNFLEKLPDKGEKPKKFAAFLRELIAERSKLEASQPKPAFEPSRNIENDSSSSGEEDYSTRSTENTAENESRTNTDKCDDPSNSHSSESDLVSRLQNVKLGEKPVVHVDIAFQNSYERVIKKSDSQVKKPKFLPHRTLQKSIDEVKGPHHKETKYKEESAAKPPEYKFNEVKVIFIDEAVLLIEEQRIKTEELMAEHAAKRLAEKLTPKMTPYTPDCIDLRYREQGKDSDDDEEEAEDEVIDSDDDIDEDENN